MYTIKNGKQLRSNNYITIIIQFIDVLPFGNKESSTHSVCLRICLVRGSKPRVNQRVL